MGKRRRIFLAVLICAFLGGLAWTLLRPAEAVYGGRPLHVWIDVLDSFSPGSDPPPVWQELGSDELVVLINALELRESGFQQVYHKVHHAIWRKLPVWVLRRLPRTRNSEDIAINALLLLQTLRGRQADAKTDMRPAIPALIYTMKANKSSTVKGMAAMVLGEIGAGNKSAAEALIAASNDKDQFLRQRASEALKSLDAEAARKVLVK